MSNLIDKSPVPGKARASNTQSVQELFQQEKSPPPALFNDQYQYLGSESISTEVFTSKKYAQKEYEMMWSKVWQMACREDELQGEGSHHLYEIGHHSFIIVRGEDMQLRAFYNSCLHRGRKLKTHSGCSKELRCPFHGFTWRLDGELKNIPFDWDFCHLADKEMSLPQVKVDTWAGFIFINMDDNCKPLTDYLGQMTDHFTRWRLEECSKVVHVKKRINCNWKIALEAFMEAYHSIATHPQIMTFSGDANSQYDILGEHSNRAIHPMGVQSAYLPEDSISQQQILDTLTTGSGRVTNDEKILVPQNGNAREIIAQISRDNFSIENGHDYSNAADTEMLDALVYNVFPNFAPWGGYAPNIVYRWLPDGNDPDSCFMEAMVLKRGIKGEAHSIPCPVHLLRDDEKWSDAEELGALGPIFDQDMGNMPVVQQGMRAAKNKKIELANFQEIRLRHIHTILNRYMQGWDDE
ncbi:MAG: phenylpropionate dioxygenase-like ring-hydroxylating dioxygenase large terminal subunit [Shewanella sp.]|jgi:phenylpropionate dioxygenase-like ring-hydroxylating dioxygenase large terminal subunit